jgi:hypothetical protein
MGKDIPDGFGESRRLQDDRLELMEDWSGTVRLEVLLVPDRSGDYETRVDESSQFPLHGSSSRSCQLD